jgi:hypothetical protein
MQPRLVPLALSLATLVAVGCVRVKTVDEPPTDSVGGLDAGSVDAEASANATAETGTVLDASTCPFSGAQGFCENFDTAPLPGAFPKIVQELGGTLVVSTATSTSGPRSLLAKVPAGLNDVGRSAFLETSFTSQEVSVEFDLRPERLHTGPKPGPVYVARVLFDETRSGDEPFHMLGLVATATNGVGGLAFVDYEGLTGKFTISEPAFPLTKGAWVRLRMTVSRKGAVSLVDVASNTLVGSANINVNADVKAEAVLRVGLEASNEQDGFAFAYDSIVVGTR